MQIVVCLSSYATNWRLVKDVTPPSPIDSWDRLQHPLATLSAAEAGVENEWMNDLFLSAAPLEFGVRLSQSDWLWINLIKWKFIQSRSMFYLWFPPMSLRTRGFCAMNLKNYKKGIQVTKNMDTVSRECNKVWPKSWLRNKHCWVHAKHCIIGGRAPLNAVKLQMPLWAVNVCIVVIAVIGGDVVWTAIWKHIPIV